MSARLTDVQRRERELTERAFQAQVASLAGVLGWSWAHWRPLPNRRGKWQTPVEGPLGVGWPDLTLVRARDRRLIFAELKRELEQPTEAQRATLAMLGELRLPATTPSAEATLEAYRAAGRPALIPTIEVYLWRPSDLRDPIETSTIGRILR